MTKPSEVQKYIESKIKKMPDEWVAKNSGRLDAWLDYIIPMAKQIHAATHIKKYTHPNAQGTSCLSTSLSLEEINGYITTSSLTTPQIDIYGNAAAGALTGLLFVEHKGKTVLDYIQENDPAPLTPFGPKKASFWIKALRDIFIDDAQPSSHTLTKQVYWPTKDGEYHLVEPLLSSSLAHEIYIRRFSKDMQAAHNARRKEKPYPSMAIIYPNTINMRFGGTKTQNISFLNCLRGGRCILLPCTPPIWKTQKKPPTKTKSVFERGYYNRRAYRLVQELQKYLEENVKRNNIHIRRRRAKYINELIDMFVQYGAEIQNLHEHAGWSASPECKLNNAESLWLDVGRCAQDEEFARERENGAWKSEVASGFARWLNGSLKSKKMTFGDAEYLEWKNLVEKNL